MAGKVFSETRKLDKAGQQVADDIALEVKGQDHPWVSRGGLKLTRGLEVFSLNPLDAICLDVGASTGGFTDVLIAAGAAKVYAVDVGHGQLAWKLRQNPRVVVLEKTNARYLDQTAVPELIDLLVCDASFISLKTVLKAPMGLTKPGANLIALIKPQFEAGREHVAKGGVVRDPEVHQSVCDDVAAWMEQQDDWTVIGVTQSPIKGPEGNIEFLISAQRAGGN